ncbi:hypothetical protein MKL09_11450 [Methylobacterium sp. J-048]|uniref:hypothetical protein n=1 Tax=Methylobacterium sp. J-048 TaxID=2836635 RepID=UPI001FBB83C0|nr:hypothetical protein [Methylobacterium sp. J-048]MCJ2057169.1 hypothetical protein [Methylobacterium sp. J-048]
MSAPPRRPGRDTRIKPGEVRNPYGRNGRPKPAVGFLDEEVTLSLNGTAATVTRREALDHFLFANSAQGQVAAIRLLHKLHPEAPADDEQAASDLSHEEREVLEAFVQQQARKLRGGEP